jgi:cell division protein FtsL
MSQPARTLANAAPARPTRTTAPARGPVPSTERARPTRTPAARPRTPTPPPPHRRARRGPSPAFWVLTAVVVTAMVVGIVSLSALVVQASFRVDALQSQITRLTDQQRVLHEQVAAESSPARIQDWARQVGMVMPADVVVLRVPATRGSGS